MNKYASYVIVGILFLLAVIFGADIGASNYGSLSIYLIVATGLYYVAHGWKYTWWYSTLLALSGFVFIHSFVFDSRLLFFVMICASSGISLVTSNYKRPPTIMHEVGAMKLGLILFLLCSFTFIQLLANWAFPYEPAHYAFMTSAKAHYELFFTMYVLLWLLCGPYTFHLKNSWKTQFIFITFIALFTNIFIRVYMFFQGYQLPQTGVGSFNHHSFGVPIINMFPGVYTLRQLSPIACVISAMLITSKQWNQQSRLGIKLLVYCILFGSFIGANLSGGRVTLPFCFLLLLMVCVVRKKFTHCLALAGCCLALVCIANMFSDTVNHKLPRYMSRSLQIVMIEKGSTYVPLLGENDARADAHKAGISEWRKDSRTFLFGRSVFKISWDDAKEISNRYGHEGFVMNAVWTGRTHSMISEILLQNGIITFILYVSSYLYIIVVFRRLYLRIPETLFFEKALAGSMFVYLPPLFVYQAIGGNYLPVIPVVILGLLRVSLSKNTGNDIQGKPVENDNVLATNSE